MKLLEIDLYSYFGIKKPENAKGILYGYLPDNSSEVNPGRTRPALLSFPGGGYDFVSFREGEPICLRFLSYGFTTFYLCYSVKRDGLHYPYPLVEAYMAKVFLHQEAEKLHINRSQICSIGFSAGAHLQGLVNSLTDEELNQEPFSLIPKDKETFKACIFSYPVVTFDERIYHRPSAEALCGQDKQLIQKLSLENRITSSFPPSFIWHTKEDSVVPYENSLLLNHVLQEKGIRNQFCLFSKGDHGESLGDITVYPSGRLKEIPKENRTWVDKALTFLENTGIRIKD